MKARKKILIQDRTGAMIDMKAIFMILLLVIAMAACDPARRINMKNESAGDAEITWVIKEDSLHKSPFFITSSKEQKFELKTEKPGNAIRMSAGIGTWTPKYLREVVNDLDSVIIRWNGKEVRLRSEEEIFAYLMARRKGIGKDKIEIKLVD
jgi:hypothetical protein